VSGGAATPSERRPLTRFPDRTCRYRTDVSRPPDLPGWSFEICRPPYRTLQPVSKLDSVIRLEPGHGLMLVATPRGSNLEPCFGECELLRGLLPWASLVVRPSPEWAEDEVYDLIDRVSQHGALPLPTGADPARIAQRVLDAFHPEPSASPGKASPEAGGRASGGCWQIWRSGYTLLPRGREQPVGD